GDHRDLHSFPTRRSSDLFGSLGGAYQAFSPVGMRSANSPPPSLGSPPSMGPRMVKSERGTYTFSASAAGPHMMPPRTPPLPRRFCHTTLPGASGSSAHITPDFCPTSSRRLPAASET